MKTFLGQTNSQYAIDLTSMSVCNPTSEEKAALEDTFSDTIGNQRNIWKIQNQ